MSKKESEIGKTAEPTRREFMGTALGAAAATSVASHAVGTTRAKPVAKVTGRVIGANDRINLAFVGCGMQFYGLLGRAFKTRKEAKNDFEYVSLCDVWEPRVKYGQEQTGALSTTRDYREVLQRSDIDGVVLAVPDHWHYKMASEACRAGKDVYLEKPMTYTVEEAAKLKDVVQETERVLQVGGSGPADKLNSKIHEYVSAGKMGKVLWGLISYNRNTREGMWDYPIPGVGSRHWPDAEVSEANLDWPMWLGPAPKRRFSPERYFRWRKYWDYSGGNATDLLYHRLGTMSTMIGFDFPTRATGAGGIYVQKNREVPDVYMTMVEYPGEYSINMISCMANSRSAPLTVYGNWGTLEVLRSSAPVGDSMGDQSAGPRTRQRPRIYASIKAERQFEKEFKEANGGLTEVTIDSDDGKDLADDWLDCMRTRQKPVYDVLRGYQVMVAIKLGVESYRQGRVMGFDPATRQIIDDLPNREVFLPPGA
jgi:predicted dehydrogenase